MAKSPIPSTSSLNSSQPLCTRYDALIAIPCCNEFASLPQTLKSLEENPGEEIQRTLVIVNVNQRAGMDRQNNEATLAWLKGFETKLNLAWLNHVSGEAAYPEKFGVGLARHQACTAGLGFIAANAPVISLDADSPVNAQYLPKIFNHLKMNPEFRAGHVNFKHRHCGSAGERQAVLIYEEHLKRHRRLLEIAQSPHAWYAIGSTIVCTKEAYLKAGGYHCRRMAGEDFYLLQQLAKTGCKISMIEDAFVYPSDRISERVPFGTGKAVSDIIKNGVWLTYHDNCYRDLGELLATIKAQLGESAETILARAPLNCVNWLKARKFEDVWPKLKSNARDAPMLWQRFNEWLDAFQTLKLIHYLSDHYYPRVVLKSSDLSGE